MLSRVPCISRIRPVVKRTAEWLFLAFTPLVNRFLSLWIIDHPLRFPSDETNFSLLGPVRTLDISVDVPLTRRFSTEATPAFGILGACILHMHVESQLCDSRRIRNTRCFLYVSLTFDRATKSCTRYQW